MAGLPVPVRGVSARVVRNKGGCGGHYAHVVADFEPPGPSPWPGYTPRAAALEEQVLESRRRSGAWTF
ncbi:hypothetical protein ACFV4Q_08560 [Streptomyces nojiriensis]|uniref:hypothetical protein n=1 Tax=Streptomyces nojiriensis TaxID=66374 RepID=UPI0036616585